MFLARLNPLVRLASMRGLVELELASRFQFFETKLFTLLKNGWSLVMRNKSFSACSSPCTLGVDLGDSKDMRSLSNALSNAPCISSVG